MLSVLSMKKRHKACLHVFRLEAGVLQSFGRQYCKTSISLLIVWCSFSIFEESSLKALDNPLISFFTSSFSASMASLVASSCLFLSSLVLELLSTESSTCFNGPAPTACLIQERKACHPLDQRNDSESLETATLIDHLLGCSLIRSVLLALLARSAAPARLLARSLNCSRARVTVEYFSSFFNRSGKHTIE